MKAPLLSVDKVFFVKTSVESNIEYVGEFSQQLKQLAFQFKGSRFARRVEFTYPEHETPDPRTFSFTFNLKLVSEGQKEGFVLPYDIDICAMALIRYHSDVHEGAKRFTAVRHAAYSILYGSIREMVCNLTARGLHGMWSLPAADFLLAAKEEGETDEQKRQKSLKLLQSPETADASVDGGLGEKEGAIKKRVSKKKIKSEKLE
ncbi:hypothetical protein [Pseudomonas farris]